MMSDIFSSFDPVTFNSMLFAPIFFIFNLIILMLIHTSFWSTQTRYLSPLSAMWWTIEQQLSRTLSINIKGFTNLASSMFILIILINLMGLIPYAFSTSSHLLFTMSLGMPFWMMLIISSLMFWPKMFVAHFLPDGAPDWLNPFLVLIETTSVVVRPITLSFRLAANMSAGHIVLGLVSIYAASSIFSSLFITLILLSVGLGYILFELAICTIQGYIFCLLLSLYANEHTH